MLVLVYVYTHLTLLPIAVVWNQREFLLGWVAVAALKMFPAPLQSTSVLLIGVVVSLVFQVTCAHICIISPRQRGPFDISHVSLMTKITLIIMFVMLCRGIGLVIRLLEFQFTELWVRILSS